jgi:hypothetical protein
MGLDMYLNRRTYVQVWDHHPPEHRWHIEATFGGQPVPLQNPSYITEQVAYWRKANAIHLWIVNTLAGGVDECQEIPMREEDLRMLVVLCRRVLASIEMREGLLKNGERLEGGRWKPILEPGQTIVDPVEAEDLLPTGSGFFFGSTDYDEYYVADLKNTVEQIEDALQVERPEGVFSSGDYSYQASW